MAEAKNPIRRVESGANGTHVEADLLWLRAQNRIQVRTAAVFSVDDVDIIAAYRWIYSSGYATRTFQDGPEARRFQVTYGMHREIMGLPWKEDTLVVDHINRTTLDNRRHTLRVVTKSETAKSDPHRLSQDPCRYSDLLAGGHSRSHTSYRVRTIHRRSPGKLRIAGEGHRGGAPIHRWRRPNLPDWSQYHCHGFSTERLRVRCPLPGDGAMVNEAIRESQDELKAWEAYFVNLPSVEESEERARRAHAKFLLREDLRLYMVRKSSGRFVGSAGLHRINWDRRGVF